MKFVPHRYQQYATQFIIDHPEALLFLDLGLGKTIITLMAVLELMYDRFEISKALIIAPLRVAKTTWPDEIAKWDQTKDLKVSVIVGDEKTRIAALMKQADVYVINREQVTWLVKYLQNRHKAWPFDFCCIDELSSFKNHRSQRFKALKSVRPFIKRMVGLTGTPAPQSLMDLFSEVGIVDKGKRLGRFITRFREEFFMADRMNPYTGIVYSYVPRDGAEEEIYGRLSDICISMKSSEYLPDMPEAITVDHEVVMSAPEKKLYDTLKSDLVMTVNDLEVTASNAAVLSGKLLQMANGALYSDDGATVSIHERKLDMLCDLIEQACGSPVLVTYWFRHDLDRITARLEAEGMSPRVLKTPEDFRDWNEGRVPVGLISPASAGHGLNLQAGGHIMIMFSMFWSLELYQQVIGRINRQGQKSVVTIHRILTRDTIDQQVAEALEHKDTTQNRLIDAVRAEVG